MIDHITLRVSNLSVSTSFYTATLAPLGYELEGTYDGAVRFHSSEEKRGDLWLYEDAPASTNVHIAFAAQSREHVDAFHAQAVKAGGTDNGAPGVRPEYDEEYYGAFVIDPDGNNIEAVSFEILK